MVKCAKCSKQLNNKSPGLQCSKCNKWLHAACANVTPDQLAILNSTDSVDWKCKTCAGPTRPKRVSCIIADPEEDASNISDSEIPNNNITQHILRQIRMEISGIVQAELQRSLAYYSDKIDDYEKRMKDYEINLKNAENQCAELKNHLKNLGLKYDVIALKCNQLEQNQLSNQLEVCGVEELDHEDTMDLVKSVATKINTNAGDIVKAYRKKIPTRPRAGSSTKKMEIAPITVILRDGSRDVWLDSGKKTNITVSDLGREGTDKVYLRESITPSTAHLLWKAKMQLRERFQFKYVWCKNGTVLARKGENEKIIVIHSLQHLEDFTKTLQTVN
ncbi:PHD-finger domain-containing protein [Phthorimaea operculella]|nr:PHD-finger domain-containing protein [Phthorimaea operculella]